MSPQHIADGRDVFARRYEYDDEAVIALDLGVEASDASVDVVDGTAIVVVETPEGERQEEFDLPNEQARAFIRNGVLTIEVNA
ncbi:Hsp20/alpha crystallin family protein [Halalkalicoccus tibetensis]|uniref:Hsp20/alpha crystallin family protein n=1 Tax=Halalkalicoccus tibetensis TaxID=175632 RepID=A0ABD5V238_9EURY